jgi:hypothetical protein
MGLMGLFNINYIFGSKVNENINIKTKPVLLNSSRKKETIYIVYNKNSDTILGAYDNLFLAKHDGQKATYNNCSILEVKLNGGCSHINKVAFEDN